MTAVRVNETAVQMCSSREAANWWALFRLHGPKERFTIVQAAIVGDVVDVTCDDREHAEQLIAHMVSEGLPKTALKITRR